MTEMLEEPTAAGQEVNRPGHGLTSSSARLGAFTDAAVAIALTLLILPLMEAIPETTTAESPPVADYLNEHGGQIVPLLISFVLIAMFWMMHHRIFRADTPPVALRSSVNFLWLFTIVILPITTALSAAMATDRLMVGIYIGNQVASGWLLLLQAVIEQRVRRAHHLVVPNRSILASPVAMAVLFTLALVLALIMPQIGYFWLFLMMLTNPLRLLLIRLGLHDRDPSGAEQPQRV